MADEFTMFLVAGLVIIAIMLAVFNLGIGPSGGGGAITTTLQANVTNISFGEGLVGLLTKEVWRTIDLGAFNTTYLSNQSILEISEKYLTNGLLFGSNELEINVTPPKDFIGAMLVFDVTKTNKYAPLLIIANNTILSESVYDVGSYAIPLNKSLIGEGTIIKIKSVSSGWKIWAPTVYELKNIMLTKETLTLVAKSFNPILYEEETKKFKKGWLELSLSKKYGNIIIEMNGLKVFNGTPVNMSPKINFNKSYITEGVNEIIFRAAKESNYTGTASMTIYYTTTQDYRIEKTFNLSRSRAESLNTNKGRLTFRVTKVVTSGGVLVQLNDDTICYSSSDCYPRIEKNRTYAFEFNSTHALVGVNKIAVKAIDEGAFEAANITITI